MPPQRPCALAQHHPLPHTPCPTPPGSATVLWATPGLVPGGRPRTGGRWPARSLHPTLKAKPPTAGRECASAGSVPDVPPVGRLLLAPGAHPPHAVRPPFHSESRNPGCLLPHYGSCVQRWPSRHTGRLVATPLPRHSSCTAATGRSRGRARALSSRPRLLPLRDFCAPLPTAVRRDRQAPWRSDSRGRRSSEEGCAPARWWVG